MWHHHPMFLFSFLSRCSSFPVFCLVFPLLSAVPPLHCLPNHTYIQKPSVSFTGSEQSVTLQGWRQLPCIALITVEQPGMHTCHVAGCCAVSSQPGGRQTRAREQDAANSPTLSDIFLDKWTDKVVFGKRSPWYLLQESPVETMGKQGQWSELLPSQDLQSAYMYYLQ